MANIYDGAFRTILNDCRKLVIPVINEIFGESYTGEEEIQFFPNEHFIDRQDEADRERVTDTNFTVFGKVQKKYHIECESSYPDGRITIRLFEYDAQIALDEGEVSLETLTVTFPNFSHENSFPEYNSNGQKLEELKAEYRVILERLDELERQGVIGAFDKRTIIELSGDVIKEIAQKYKNVQEGVGDMMRGPLIETTARRLKNEAENEAKRKTALRMLRTGKLTIEEIAECSELSVAEVEQLVGLQTV